MHLTRRQFSGLFGSSFAAALLAGCEGSTDSGVDDAITVTTETNGRAVDGFVSPRPGDAFISRNTVFQLAWLNAAPPPREFKVSLRRYEEGLGGEERRVTSQRITVERVGSQYRWNVRRRDGFSLDDRGTYYLEVADFTGTQQYAYLVDSGRAAEISDPSRAVTINTGGGGRLADVEFFPRCGSCFIPSNTNFTMAWQNSAPPPTEVRIEIRRYKEARGTQEFRDEEQAVEVFRNSSAGSYAWSVRRRDNFRLDRNGVYYIKLTSPGQSAYNAVYIVGDF